MPVLLLYIIAFILTVGFIIGLHELGHFFAARALGIKVLSFSIGLGKPLYRWRSKKGIEYIISMFPIGGYVNLLDEESGKVASGDSHMAFNRQPLYKKILVIGAGPFCNLLFAFFAYWMIFAAGVNVIQPKIGEIIPHSIAAQAGLKPKQIILSVDGKKTLGWSRVILAVFLRTGDQGALAITTKSTNNNEIQHHVLKLKHWKMNSLNPKPLYSLGIVPFRPAKKILIKKILSSNVDNSGLKLGDEIVSINKEGIRTRKQAIKIISSLPNMTVPVTLKRKGKAIIVFAKISSKRNILLQDKGYLGINIKTVRVNKLRMEINYSFWRASKRAYHEVVDLTVLNFVLIGKLIVGDISIRSLVGPITIFTAACGVLQSGIVPFLSFLALISLSIGFVNILPIPGLDGGQACFFFIEAIFRNSISKRVKILLYRLGFILICFILFQTVLNDLMRMAEKFF